MRGNRKTRSPKHESTQIMRESPRNEPRKHKVAQIVRGDHKIGAPKHEKG